MMQKILVEVGYYDFYFDCMQEAVAFAAMAKQHIGDGDEDKKVTLTVKFAKEKVDEEGINEED